MGTAGFISSTVVSSLKGSVKGSIRFRVLMIMGLSKEAKCLT